MTDIFIRNVINPNAPKLVQFIDRAWIMVAAILVTCTLLRIIG